MYDAIPNVMFEICQNKLPVHTSINLTNYTDILSLISVEHFSHEGKYNVRVFFFWMVWCGVGGEI